MRLERAGGNLCAFLLFAGPALWILNGEGNRIMRLWLTLIYLLFTMPARAEDGPQFGVFGMVEQLSPLVVAGLQIAVPEDVPLISLLGQGEPITLGDTLALRLAVDEGRLTAKRMLEIYPIIGPVSKVVGDTAVVMGSGVHLPPDVSVKKGQWVAASGFWSGEKVITTRLHKLSGGWFGHLTGVINYAESRLGGSDLGDAQVPLEGGDGAIWILSGNPESTGLGVTLSAKGVFGGDVALALWQGHASSPIASQTYMIHGTGVTGTARDALMPEVGKLITRCAREGRIVHSAPDGLEVAYAALGCATHIRAD